MNSRTNSPLHAHRPCNSCTCAGPVCAQCGEADLEAHHQPQRVRLGEAGGGGRTRKGRSPQGQGAVKKAHTQHAPPATHALQAAAAHQPPGGVHPHRAVGVGRRVHQPQPGGCSRAGQAVCIGCSTGLVRVATACAGHMCSTVPQAALGLPGNQATPWSPTHVVRRRSSGTTTTCGEQAPACTAHVAAAGGQTTGQLGDLRCQGCAVTLMPWCTPRICPPPPRPPHQAAQPG